MIPSKRKRRNDERSSSEQDFSDDENDILNALSGKRHSHQEVNSDDDDFDTFLMGSIAKRDVKIGTGVVKNAKKNRVKGEIGGGSFQSMGQYNVSLPCGIL